MGTQVRDPNDIFLFRTGSDERAAGRLTAQRLLKMGVKGRVVVGDQQPGDATCREYDTCAGSTKARARGCRAATGKVG